jgi:hypothetical protein
MVMIMKKIKIILEMKMLNRITLNLAHGAKKMSSVGNCGGIMKLVIRWEKWTVRLNKVV